MTDEQWVTEGHLGGYQVGGDAATFYPDLWTWLTEMLGTRVIDIGCGDGVAVRHFAELGCAVLGIEGVPQEHSQIVAHDFTLGPYPVALPEFDFAWSCEFVEHVEERYIPNYLAAFKAARRILITHADVGQPGWHHVNCKPAYYWLGVFGAIGYRLDPSLTHHARGLARRNEHPLNHFARSGLAFTRA